MRVEEERPTRADPSPRDPFLGQLFGGCRIDEVIGRGGMGVVYKATQLSLNRPVAIKVLPEEVCGQPQFTERFKREVDILARLSHPNVVTVFERGEVDGRLYVVMEYVQGTSLREVMRKGPLPSGEALVIVRSVLSALEHAHGRGIIHRDVKPENVLVAPGGIVKVADFGLSRLTGPEEATRHTGPEEATRLTHTNVLLGTYEYMAPEQRERAKEADERADIYATGVVLYEMLAGELPIGHFAALSRKRPKECDSRIDEIVEKSLAKSPADRYQRASEMGAAVSRVLSAAMAPEPPAPATARPREEPADRPRVHAAATVTIGDEGAPAVLPRRGRKDDPAEAVGCLVFLVGLVFGLGFLRSAILAVVALIAMRALPALRRPARWIAILLCVLLVPAVFLLMTGRGSAGRPEAPPWMGDPGIVRVETRNGWFFGNVPIGVARGELPASIETTLLDEERIRWLEKVAPVPFTVGPDTVHLTVAAGKVVVSIQAELRGSEASTSYLNQLGAALSVALERAYPQSFLRDPALPNDPSLPNDSGGSAGSRFWDGRIATYGPLTTEEARKVTDHILADPRCRDYLVRWCDAPASFPEGVSISTANGSVSARLDFGAYNEGAIAVRVLDGLGRWIAHVGRSPFRAVQRLSLLPSPAMVEGVEEPGPAGEGPEGR